MPEHTLQISLRDLEVGPVDVRFVVGADEARFGKLLVSQGGIDWYPRDAKQPFKLTWEEFDKVLKERWGVA
jgi:hypothetical protein